MTIIGSIFCRYWSIYNICIYVTNITVMYNECTSIENVRHNTYKYIGNAMKYYFAIKLFWRQNALDDQ